MNSRYEMILDALYEKYFAGASGFSSVTSSHWRDVGSVEAARNGGRYSGSGTGFGDFRNRTLKNRVRTMVSRFLLRRLLNRLAPPPVVAGAKSVLKSSNYLLSFDAVKQVLAVDRIFSRLGFGYRRHESDIPVVAVIGDGYGFMTRLLMSIDPQLAIVCVNLGRTLFVDALHVAITFPDREACLIESAHGIDFAPGSVNFVEAENAAILTDTAIDLFINIASMQEMDPPVIGSYFDLIRSSTSPRVYFYCCNREEKVLPDGTRVTFEEYPWDASDEIVFDELCPWYQKYPADLPPFWRPFDGPIRHRLVNMSTGIGGRQGGSA